MEYAKLPGLTPDGTMYWNEEIGTVEAVLPPGGYKTAHGPGLLELENGDMPVSYTHLVDGNDVHAVIHHLAQDAGGLGDGGITHHGVGFGEIAHQQDRPQDIVDV